MSKHSFEWTKSGKVPARKSVLESSEFQALSPENAFAKELPYVHFPPALAGVGDALARMYDGVQAAVLGKSDPAAALKSSAAKATKILQDNAKKYGKP